jgi:hypothetical protein
VWMEGLNGKILMRFDFCLSVIGHILRAGGKD